MIDQKMLPDSPTLKLARQHFKNFSKKWIETVKLGGLPQGTSKKPRIIRI